MKPRLISTFLELGDATSHNLQFSHRADVSVSYGEETITETNLLEFRRRHPDRVYVHSFSKAIEAKAGADWEWHIVGKRRTAKMRVQAKRVQSNKVLRIKHRVSSSGEQQRNLLIRGADVEGMKPIYCIYCAEKQRSIWTQPKTPEGYSSYQTGCLLADALDVPLHTRKLDEIEEKCIPWHYLVERSAFVYRRFDRIDSQLGEFVDRLYAHVDLSPIGLDVGETGPKWYTGWNAPTIDDLNGESTRDFDKRGVQETTTEDENRLQPDTNEGGRIYQHDRRRLYEAGITRMLIWDVRELSEPKRLRELLSTLGN